MPDRGWGSLRLGGAIGLCFLLLGSSYPADAAKKRSVNPVSERLKQLDRQAAESKARAGELTRRTQQIEKDLAAQRQNLTDAAKDVRASEQSLSRLEDEQADLTAQYTQEAFFLGLARAQLSRLTAGLTGLARIPPGGLLARMDSPIDAARAQMLITAALTATREKSAEAEHEITVLDDLGHDLDAKRREGARASALLRSHQIELAALIGKRQTLYVQTEADRKTETEHAEKIAEEANDLRDLMARVEAEEQARRLAEARKADARRKVSARSPLAESTGHFNAGPGLPVAGDIKIRFGQNDGLGATTHGITLAARPGASVTAPSAGVVRFAGPFRGYHEILILEHPGGYHSLIAGMSRINVAVGASVGSGEPVGVMAAGAMDERANAKPELYYELRHNGQFIDPEATSVQIDAPKGAAPRVDVKGKAR